MLTIEPITIQLQGNEFTIPAVEGDDIVSPVFGVHTDRGLMAHITDLKAAAAYLAWEGADCRMRGSMILKGTGVFRPGQSIYWIDNTLEHCPILRCFTLAVVEAKTSMDEVFEVLKTTTFDRDVVYDEVLRMSNLRTSLGLVHRT